MATLLKHYYNDSFFEGFCTALKNTIPEFKAAEFMQKIHDHSWVELELKQRMRHISTVLHDYLDQDYLKALPTLVELSQYLIKHSKGEALQYMLIPDYIEQYGQQEFDASMKAFEVITELSSCEFAIRPFIIQNQQKALAIMLSWTKHSNVHVRRLATEGCRPRLPWAMALPTLKDDPKPILPILENLKNDSAEYVRKSVANNLNDISKDHPTVLIDHVIRWKGNTKETDWILKHGARTLLKQGHPEIMSLFGYGGIEHLKTSQFKLHEGTVQIGHELQFDVNIQNTSKDPILTRIEYAIYYLRANGSHSKKVFKISEKELLANDAIQVNRKQSFKLITTRKFYAGQHYVSIILNGTEKEKLPFTLK